MGLSFEDVAKIKGEFEIEYWFCEPWIHYVNGCGISKVGTKDKMRKHVSESENWCMSVYLKKSLPADLFLPDVYKGVRVFVEVGNEVVFH